jgi:predicted metal-dependent hydrolase
VMHELAHLEVPSHSPRFWRLVDRYPLAERARGFLIAKGWED